MLQVSPPRVDLQARRLPEFLHGPPPPGSPFNFLSMDPPFMVSRQPRQLRGLCDALTKAQANGWFSADALLIWEEPGDAPDPVPEGFREVSRRSFGTSRLRFFQVTGKDFP